METQRGVSVVEAAVEAQGGRSGEVAAGEAGEGEVWILADKGTETRVRKTKVLNQGAVGGPVGAVGDDGGRVGQRGA